MARHAQENKSRATRGIAAASLFSLTAMPLVVFPGAAFSSSDCSNLGTVQNKALATLLSDGVCQVAFLESGSVSIPAGVTKVSILLVGGGAGSVDDGVGYSGAGGQVAVLESTSLAGETLNAVIGAGSDGDFSSTPNGAATSLEIQGGSVIARGLGGFSYQGTSDDQKAYQWTTGVGAVTDTKNNPVTHPDPAYPVGAAGTGGDATVVDTAELIVAGGPGRSVVELKGGGSLDSTLWATDYSAGPAGSVLAANFFNVSFGAGGSIYKPAANPIAPLTGSGWGGSIKGDGNEFRNGSSGVVIMRFVIPAASYTVTFDANGGTGSMSNQTASSATNLTSNSFTRTGFSFAGWNTAANGTGTAYANGASYAFTANATLYAQWSASTYTVTFDANGGTGSMSNQTGSSSAALTSNTLTRSGFTFAGWNTAADGSGTAFADGASYAFNANLTLYAQWTATTPPAPTPYTGPIPVKLDVSCVPSTGGKATLTGERLSGITAATVDGKTVVVSNASASSVDLEFPALAAGTYDIQYVSSNGNITQQGGLRVCATSTSSTPPAPGDSGSAGSGDSDAGSAAPERLYVYKRFTNYLGDRGGVVAADRKAITDFIKANPGLTHVTCVGSTSGVPAIETDPALATARANNACSIVEELIPGVETRIATNVGLGVGQFYRAVTLFGKGTKD